MAREAPRPGHDVQATGLGGRRIELEADVDRRTRDRMAAEPAVAMPRQVGQPFDDVRILDHDRVPVAAVERRMQLPARATRAGEGARRRSTRRSRARRARGRRAGRAPACAGRRRPPRSAVAGAGGGLSRRDDVGEPRDLVAREHASRARSPRRRACAARRRAPRAWTRREPATSRSGSKIGRPERRAGAAPAPELRFRTAYEAHPSAVEEARGGRDLATVAPGVEVELDDDVVVARLDADRVRVRQESGRRGGRADGTRATAHRGRRGTPPRRAGSRHGRAASSVELVEVGGRRVHRHCRSSTRRPDRAHPPAAGTPAAPESRTGELRVDGGASAADSAR